MRRSNDTISYGPWLSACCLVEGNGWSPPASGMAVKTVSHQDLSGSTSHTYLVDLANQEVAVPLSGGSTSISAGSPLTLTTRTVERGANDTISSYSLHNADGLADRFLAGRPRMTWDSTGKATLYEYEQGIWNAPVFTPNPEDPTGTDVRTSAIAGYIAAPAYNSTPDDFAAILGHSVMTVTITTAQGVAREETHICDATDSFALASARDHEYESATVTTTTAYEPGTRRAKSITTTTANTAARLLIRPDPASSLTYTGLDADSDGDLTPASADRLTETRQSYAKVGTRWWRITKEKTYDQTGSAASAIITTTKERLHGNADGHASATVHILPGGGTVTTTTAIDRAARTLTSTTTRSGHALPETTVNLNGLEISRTTHHSATPARFGYDNLGRLIVEVNPTGAATVMERDPTGRLKSVTSPSGHTTSYTYWPADHHAAGRPKTTTLPSPLPVGEGQGEGVQHTTTREWSTRGELLAITGTATYPVAYTYDAHGALETQTTWRDATNSATAQTTTWIYRPNSGVLWKRVNADTTETLHTYHPNGLPHTRTRPGGATTTWTYNPLSDLTAIDYTGDADRTPDVAITAHTRLGAPVTITQIGIGTETRAYYPGTGAPEALTYPTAHALLPGKSIAWPQPDEFGRPLGLTPSDGPAVAYDWNDQGLLETVTAGAATHTYAYRPGTSWLQSATANDGTADTFRQHYARDKAGRLLSATSHTLAGTAPAALTHHAYQHDELDRPYRATLLDGSTWTWARNERGEITSAVRELPGEIEVPALGATYDFDDIGNRKAATSPILGDFDYTPNAVNQYTSIATNDTRTVLGNAPVSPAVTVNDGGVDRIPPDTGTIFHKAITGTNLNAPVWLEANVSDGTTTQTRHTWLPASTTAPEYDDDCNLTNDGQWGYLWDAENRLVEMETTPTAVTAGRPYRKLIFAYDWTGRRLARTVYGPNATLLSATRWLYDGWNPVAEFSDQTTGQTFIRAYLWGMDLSGTMQGAGGVGGLLSVFEISNSQISNRYFPSYDGNGNIVAWTASGATASTCLREYDSFGNILIEHGTPPCALGFSTKLEDPETGLLYYGYRYLSPPLGRWLSNDPLEENHDTGEFNALVFILNDPIGGTDLLGMARQEGGRNSVPPANRGPGPYQPTRIDQVPAPIKRPIPMLPTGEGPNITRDSGGTGRLPTNIQGPPIVKGPVITPRTGTPWIDDPWKPWEPLAPIQPRGSPLGPRTPGAGIGGLGIVLEIVHFTEDMARLRRLVGHIEFIAGWVAAGKSAAYAKIGRPCSGCLVLDIAEYMSIPGNAKLKPAGHPTGVAAFEILFYERPCKDVNYKGEPWAFYDPHAIRRRTVKEDVILP